MMLSSPKAKSGLLLLIVILFSCGDHTTKNKVVPVAPSDFHATALSPNRVYLSWQDNSTDETGFDIYRRPLEIVFWTKVVRLPFNIETYVDSTATDSTAYMYYVSAFNAAGSSETSNYSTVTTPSIGHAPEMPFDQIPWNGADTVAINPLLSWRCSDPDGDTLVFDVKLGFNQYPEIIRQNWPDTTLYLTQQLRPDTTYYWQVIAIDPHTHRVASPIWYFRTLSPGHPPNVPINPVPFNGVDSISLNPTMSWSCTDIDGDTLVYDIKFSTSFIPALIHQNWPDTSFTMTGLQQNTVYYWQVIAIDRYNHRTPSPVWWFRTMTTTK